VTEILVKDAYDKLTDDAELYKLFLDCISKGYCDNFINSNQKKEMWKRLVTKTFHARVGVITGWFAEDTAGHFSATAKTEALRLELKIKTRDKAIARSAKIVW